MNQQSAAKLLGAAQQALRNGGIAQAPFAMRLQESLDRSGSTWDYQNKWLNEKERKDVVLARTTDGKSYYSTRGLGPSEMTAGVWIRKRMALGCKRVKPVRNGLSSEQKDAATLVLGNPVSCLTGFPGTGKTTTAEVIYNSLIAAGHNVTLCAFMGSAASNLSQRVGATASTIHSVLEYDGFGFARNQFNKVDCTAIMIDEAGTLGSILNSSLLSALPHDCLVIYIGDQYQMPSVENGNVLSNLCESIPHVHLFNVQRTDPDGPIGYAAKSIFNGEMPTTSERDGEGYFFIDCNDENLIGKTQLVHKHLSLAGSIPYHEVRIMASTNDLSDRYNQYVSRINTGIVPVVCRRNNKILGIYNGDFGVLSGDEAHFQKECLIRASIRSNDIRTAFATTVNVQQGKECHSAAFMCPQKGAGVPSRSLIYTALTRAKKRFAVVGNGSRLKAMIENGRASTRVTLLSKFIRGEAEIVTQE